MDFICSSCVFWKLELKTALLLIRARNLTGLIGRFLRCAWPSANQVTYFMAMLTNPDHVKRFRVVLMVAVNREMLNTSKLSQLLHAEAAIQTVCRHLESRREPRRCENLFRLLLELVVRAAPTVLIHCRSPSVITTSGPLWPFWLLLSPCRTRKPLQRDALMCSLP